MELYHTVEKDDNAVLENEEREELEKYNIKEHVGVRVILVMDGHFVVQVQVGLEKDALVFTWQLPD